MIDDTHDYDCLTFRKMCRLKQSAQVLTAPEQSHFDEHSHNCCSCSSWLTQHEQIAEMSRHLPQFDVSEGLTRNILDSIEKENTPGLDTSLLPLGIVAAVIVLVMVPVDSFQSIYAWGSGILGLLALQFLMKTANTQEKII